MWLKNFLVRLCGCLLACSPILACAETRYVTDELRLSMYEEINSQGKLLQRLGSGTELELLEINGMYARVRTKEGVEGWTKAGFLIEDKPARLQLLDLQQQHEALQQRLAQSQRALEQSHAELEKIRQDEGSAYGELTERLKQAEAIAAGADALKEENAALKTRLSGDETRIPLRWGAIAGAVALVLGLVGGIALFDYLSRRRHGGYRIY